MPKRPIDIKSLNVFDRFMFWIKERESIRLKKEANEPKPWTDHEFLRDYRYCNVRRMDDKVSKWLEDNWYKPFFGHKNMILACTLARQFNRIESLEAVGFPKRWDPDRYDKILHQRAEDKKKNFGAAYMTTGTLGGTKVHQMIWKVTNYMHLHRPDIDGSSLQETVNVLIPYPGFSNFMAGQVTADLRWAIPGEWKDRHTWAPKGPGSTRGLELLLNEGLEVDDPGRVKIKNQTDFMEHFVPYMKRAKEALPEAITSRMEAHDYQNTLCECYKFSRLINGSGRPKQRYKGSPE